MRVKIVVLILVLALVLPFVGVSTASAQGEHCASGYVFGQHHAEMARAGMLGQDMNPGMHQGFSHCLE